MTNLDHLKTLAGLFYQGSPEINLTGSVLGSIWGSMKVKEGPLSPARVPKLLKKFFKMVGGILDDVQHRNGIHILK